MKKANGDVIYTEAQLNIIQGKTSIKDAHGLVLRNLHEKALKNNDADILVLLDKEFKRRDASNHYGASPYTEKQMQIINGEIPLESLNGHALHWFYKKALDNKDEDLVTKIKIQLDILKKEATQRNIKRAVARRTKLRNRESIQWKQPKSNEYTEHQKQIVRNEIPLDKVHTKELISIHLKAHNVGDFELSERMLDLINERREASISREALSTQLAQRRKKVSYDSNSNLTVSEQALINGDTHWEEYEDADIIGIIAKLEKEHNEFNLNVAKEILHYKQHPKSSYIVTTYDEAIDLLEELLKTDIRRPNTWFIEEETG